MHPLPSKAAKALCRRIPASWVSEKVLTAGGPSRVRVVPSSVRIRVRTDDRAGRWARVDAIVSSQEREILVSDTVIDLLGVEIKSHGAGLWRFGSERRVRRSVPPRDW